MNAGKFITIKDYADRNGVTLKTVYNRINNGTIPKESIKKLFHHTLIKVN